MNGKPANVRLGLRGAKTPRHWQVREGRWEYLQAIRFRELVEAERRGETLIPGQAAEIEAAIVRGALLPLPDLLETLPNPDNEDAQRIRRAVDRPVLKDLRENEAALRSKPKAVEKWAIEHGLGDNWTIKSVMHTLELWSESPRSRQLLEWSARFDRQAASGAEFSDPPNPRDFPDLKAYLAAAEAAYKQLQLRQAKARWARTMTKDARVFEWLAERKVFGLTLADIAQARPDTYGMELDSYRKAIERVAQLIGVTL